MLQPVERGEDCCLARHLRYRLLAPIRVFVAAAAFVSACSDDGGSLSGRRTLPLGQVVEEELANEATVVVCNQPPEPALISVLLAPGSDEVNFEARRGAPIEITIASRADVSGTADLTATSTSEAGRSSALIASVAIPPNGMGILLIDPAMLGLPDGAFEHSGSMLLEAEAVLEDGLVARSLALPLFFHPTEDGWRFYDESARDQVWSHGAIGTDARDRLPEILERASPGAIIGSIGEASVNEIVEDPLEGPPDEDAEGGR